jgi:hypothetical protein
MRAMIRPRWSLLPLAVLVLGGCGRESGEAPPEASPSPAPSTYAQNLLGGLERTAVEKTRSDMLAIGTAISACTTESGGYPEASDFASLAALVSPAYIRVLPQRDAWGSTYRFERRPDGWNLVAPGADGAAGTADDIVLTEGGFTQLPAGYRPVF